MSNAVDKLINFKKEKDFLICIDSDGCALDAMELKHKECFAPNFIKYWDLNSMKEYAQEAWEFVNLYSSTRGCNRFQGIIYSLDLLAKRQAATRLGYIVPDISSLRKWVSEEKKLGNPALEEKVNKTNDSVLKQALDWSKDVNLSVSKLKHKIVAFPSVKKALEMAGQQADLMVVSAASVESLSCEWEEQGLAAYVKVIAGQEMGTKMEHISYVKEGRYQNHHVLKIGDAFGDLQAAKGNGVCFYPINPGHEEESWKRLWEEGLDRFFSESYTGEYEDRLIREFRLLLPDALSWKED